MALKGGGNLFLLLALLVLPVSAQAETSPIVAKSTTTATVQNGWCTYSGDCSNGGSCVNSLCICVDGYYGDRCENQEQSMSLCGERRCYNGATCYVENGENKCYCMFGFRGEECNQRVELSTLRPTTTPSPTPYKTSSPSPTPYWTSTPLPSPLPQSCYTKYCLNGGTCVANSYCYCRYPFTGSWCENVLSGYVSSTTVSPATCNTYNNTCTNGGSCLQGRCSCRPNFEGAKCERQTPKVPCSNTTCENGGTCMEFSDYHYQVCLCADGYYGNRCELFDIYTTKTNYPTTTVSTNPNYPWTYCDGVYCQNGGSCLYGKCSCRLEYSGKSCEIRLPDNGCTTSSCVNGRCASVGYCECYSGYTGYKCDVRMAANDCYNNECGNGGSCYMGRCSCYQGYMGRFCERQTTLLSCDEIVCENGGTCVDYSSYRECRCMSGYTGLRCEERESYNYTTTQSSTSGFYCNGGYCQNGASCWGSSSGDYCACLTGFTGQFCETELCMGGVCYNGGKCIRNGNYDYCSCRYGYSGIYCTDSVNSTEGDEGRSCMERFTECSRNGTMIFDANVPMSYCQSTNSTLSCLETVMEDCGNHSIAHQIQMSTSRAREMYDRGCNGEMPACMVEMLKCGNYSLEAANLVSTGHIRDKSLYCGLARQGLECMERIEDKADNCTFLNISISIDSLRSSVDSLCQQVPSDNCTTVNCLLDPCMSATCPGYPDATCRSNYCGGCFYDFYINDTKIWCMEPSTDSERLSVCSTKLLTCSNNAMINFKPGDPSDFCRASNETIRCLDRVMLECGNLAIYDQIQAAINQSQQQYQRSCEGEMSECMQDVLRCSNYSIETLKYMRDGQITDTPRYCGLARQALSCMESVDMKDNCTAMNLTGNLDQLRSAIKFLCEPSPCESNPCGMGGSCFRDGTGHICYCPDLTSGKSCSGSRRDSCADNPCGDGGTCMAVNSTGYTCLCSDGSYGPNCNASRLCDYFTEDPCLPYGKCIGEVEKGDLCSCPSYREGIFCQVDDYESTFAVCLRRKRLMKYIMAVLDGKEQAPVQLNGSIYDIFRGMGVSWMEMPDCTAEGTYSPVMMSFNIYNTSDRLYYCVDRDGRRENFSTTSYYYPNCTALSMGHCGSNPCQNQGTCIPTYTPSGESYTCSCRPGFYGNQCEISVCSSLSFDICSLSGGKCHGDLNSGELCRCPTGRTGVLCDREGDDTKTSRCRRLHDLSLMTEMYLNGSLSNSLVNVAQMIRDVTRGINMTSMWRPYCSADGSSLGVGCSVDLYNTSRKICYCTDGVDRILDYIPPSYSGLPNCSRSGTKPGRCPVVGNSTVGTGIQLCNTDTDCVYDMKCCFNGLGYQCKMPETWTNPVVKPGNCPVVANSTGGMRMGIPECYNDTNCKGELKCCFNGFQYLCEMPVRNVTRVKPGLCPSVDNDTMTIGIHVCNNDMDCSGELKCCFDGFSQQCTMPARNMTDVKPPRIVAVSDDQIAVEKQTVTLKCSAEGGEPIRYMWMKDGYTVTNGPTLQWSVTDNDEEFQCVATNSYGTSMSDKVRVRRAYLNTPPASEKITLRSDVGNMLKLECNLENGLPESKTRWMVKHTNGSFSDVDMPERFTLDLNGNLIIKYTLSEDSSAVRGNYACMMENPMLRKVVMGNEYVVRVQEVPLSAVKPSYVQPTVRPRVAVAGEEFIIQCVFSGYPLPSVEIKKVNGTISSKSYSRNNGEDLVLVEVEEADEGEYMCVGSNSAGVTERYMYLQVVSKPTWKEKPQTVEVTPGNNAVFKCLVNARPKAMSKWYINGKETNIYDNNRLRVDGDGNQVLIVKNITLADKMVVQCNVSNNHGYVWGESHLVVIRNKPGNCPMIANNSIGIGIQECNTDRDCRDELKCCSNGFGNQCMQPERNVSKEDCMSVTAECLNGGTCVSSIGGGYFCYCTVHYTGPNCRTRIQTACDSSPCQNGATCQPYRNGDYSCSCPNSWGKNCENPNYDTCRCEFNQRCILKEECGRYNCTVNRRCQDETTYDPCGRRPCSENAVCVVTRDNVNYRCQCKPGFSGPDCTTNNTLCNKHNITTFCRRYDYGSYCVGDLKNGRLCNCSQGRSGVLCEVSAASEPTLCQQRRYFHDQLEGDSMTLRPDERSLLQRLAVEGSVPRGVKVNCTGEGHFHPVQCRNESDQYSNWTRRCYCVDQRGNVRSNLTTHAGYAPCTAPNMTEDLSRVICSYPQAYNLCWNGGRCRGDLFKGRICDCAPGFGGIFCQRKDNDTSDEPTSLCTLSEAAFNLMTRIKTGNFSWTYDDLTVDPTTLANGNGSFSDVMDRFSRLLLSGFDTMVPPLKEMIDSSYIPRPNCSADGEFLPTQCDVSLRNGTISGCYCVYRNGTEIRGSRTSYPMMPYCSHMSNSTGRECNMTCSLECPNGRRRGMDGCEICDCKASCDGVFCGMGSKCMEGVCKPMKKRGQCPVQVHDNYYQMLNSTYQESCSTECQDDSDCRGDKKCCPGCGTTCLDPIEQRPCEAHWWDVTNRLSAISNFTSYLGNIGQLMNSSSTIVATTWKPFCDQHGDYDKKQCRYQVSADGSLTPLHCFCVNTNGAVVRGTQRNVTVDTAAVFSCEEHKPGVCPVSNSSSFNMTTRSCERDYDCINDEKCCSGKCTPAYSAKMGNMTELCADNSSLCTSIDEEAVCVGDWSAAKLCQCSRGYTGLLCTLPVTGETEKLTTCQRKRQLFQLVHNGFSSTDVAGQPNYTRLVEALQRSLGNRFYNLSMMAARCKEGGEFHEKQCDVALMTNQTDRCFCVNQAGHEILGTAKKPPHMVDCLPKPMNVCKEGEPLGNGKTYVRCKWNNTCGLGYKCEQQKVTSSNGDYYENGYCCLDRTVSDPCNLAVDYGVDQPCSGDVKPIQQVRYYYGAAAGRCMSYSVSNCTSLPVNTNSFLNLADCIQRCEVKEKTGTCPVKPPTYGPGNQCSDQCNNDDVCTGEKKCCQTSCGKRCLLAKEEDLSSISRIYPCRPGLTPTIANNRSINCDRGTNGQCPEGSYCDIAANDAWAVCCPDSSIDVCAMKRDIGPCKAAMPRWSFNKQSGRCEMFYYGGCAGNDNNFLTREECCNACGSNKCKEDECPAVQPGVLANCAATCSSDADCEGRQLCCSNGCGRSCMIPTKNSTSTCFKELEKSRLRMMMVKPNQCSTVYLPRCNDDGSWRREQCYDSYGICWCVSSDGSNMTIPQKGRLSCDESVSASGAVASVSVCEGESSVRCCSPHLCKVSLCPSDPHAVCRVNPCGDQCTVDFYNKDNQIVNCTDGLSECELHQYKALISRYQQKINNITSHQQPPSNNQTIPTTRASVEVCKQPKMAGKCRAYFPRWYYNATTSTCEKFVYGGCNGNDNNFPRAEECYNQCNPQQHPCKSDSCQNPDETCVIQSDPNCMNGACRHFAACVKASPSPQLSGVYVPTCTDTKTYGLKQCHQDYCWCVNPIGDVFPNSMTSGPMECSSDGPIIESLTPQVCPDQSSPNKECVDACRSQVCPDHPDAVCTVDLCSRDCSVKFVDVSGKEVTCGSDSCKLMQATPNKDCAEPVICPSGSSQQVCDPSKCSTARCPGNPCAVCSVDPCTCEVKFTDMLTNETITDCLQVKTPTCKMEKCSVKNEMNRAQLMGVVVDMWEPQCEADGRYKPQQCDSNNQCWCVDGRGQTVVSLSPGNCVMNETASVVVQIKFEKDFDQVKDKMPEFEASVLRMMEEWGILQFVEQVKISAGSVVVETTFKDKNADSSTPPDPLLSVVPDFIHNKVKNGEAKVMFENETWVAEPAYFESKTESQVYRPEVVSEDPPPGEEGLGEKMIIVISVVCTVVGCVVVGIVVWACCCRKRKQDSYIEDTLYQSGKSSPELPFGVSNNLYMTNGASPRKPTMSEDREEDVVNYKL